MPKLVVAIWAEASGQGSYLPCPTPRASNGFGNHPRSEVKLGRILRTWNNGERPACGGSGACPPLYMPAGDLGQKRQPKVDLNPQAHPHLSSAIKGFPGPGVEAGMGASRGQDGVCTSKRSAWPGLLAAQVASSWPQAQSQGFQSGRSLEVSHLAPH